jgi:hypothetical protein
VNEALSPVVRCGEAEYVARPGHGIPGRHYEDMPARLPVRETNRAPQRGSHQRRTVIPVLQREVIALQEHYSIVVHRCGDWNYRRVASSRVVYESDLIAGAGVS